MSGLTVSLHPTGSAVPVEQPIRDFTGRPPEWDLRQANKPIDLRHAQRNVDEQANIVASADTTQVENPTRDRTNAAMPLPESVTEVARLKGSPSDAHEEGAVLRTGAKTRDDCGNSTPDDNKLSTEPADLRRNLALKDEEIARLRRDWAAAREEAGALRQKLLQIAGTDDRAQELSFAMSRDLDAALAALAEREHELQRSHAALAEMQASLEQAAINTAPPDASMAATLAERDQRISDLIDHERKAMEEADQLRNSLREREAEFQAAHFEIAELRRSAEDRERLSSDYADISQTLVDSRTRLKEQETKLAAVELERQMLQSQLDGHVAELQRLHYELAEQRQRTEMVQPGHAPLTEIACDELNQTIEALKAQSAAATQRAWSLHRALEKAAERVKRRDAENAEITARLNDALQAQKGMALECDAAKSAVMASDQLKVAFDEALSLVAQRDEQLGLLQMESAQWQSRLDERSGEFQQLAYERDLATQQCREAEAETQAEQQRLRAALTDLETARAELEETRTFLIQREQRLESASAELALRQTREAEREAEIQRLHAHLDEASRAIEAAAFDSDAERAKWQPILANHEEMKAACDDLRAQLATREEQIAAFRAAAAAQDTELVSLREAAEKFRVALQERDDKIDDLDFQVAGVTATISEKGAALAVAIQERDEAVKALAEVRQAEADVRIEVESVRRDLEQSRQEARTAQERLAPAEAESQRMREDTARYAAREKDLRSALDHRMSEVEALLAEAREFKARERALASEIESRAIEAEELRAELESRSVEVEQLAAAKQEAELLAQNNAVTMDESHRGVEALRAQLATLGEERDRLAGECSALREENLKSAEAVELLRRDCDRRSADLKKQIAESETLRKNVELYRENSDELEVLVRSLRSEIERHKTEKESIDLSAREAQKDAARFNIELATLREELEKQRVEKNSIDLAVQASRDAEARSQTEREQLRTALAAATDEVMTHRKSAEDATAAKAALEAELAAAHREAHQLHATLESVRAQSDEAGRTDTGHIAEIESLRAELQRLQREAEEYKSAREQESRRLTQQLEDAVSEVSSSAREIQRLSGELENARAHASGDFPDAELREKSLKFQHSIAGASDELWKHAPAGDDVGEPVTSEEVGVDEQDEQKMLVDALLRFLGRR